VIRLIVAADNHLGIAKDGRQPWSIPADEKYFTQQTKSFGGMVLEGYKTYQVIGRPYKDRITFVLTHHEPPKGTIAVHNLKSFLKDMTADLWIVGGESIYNQTLKDADEVWLTQIDADFKCDQFFPDFVRHFEVESQSDWKSHSGIRFRYSVYARKKIAK
jgi:dihydrofolate reductase